MSFLDRLLRGTPPATPEETDQLTVRRLEGAGANLAKPRHIVHFLNFDNEASAREAAAAAERGGYETTVAEPEEDTTEWTVRAEASRVVDPITVVAYRSWFEQLATAHRGEYEGWEAWPKP